MLWGVPLGVYLLWTLAWFSNTDTLTLPLLVGGGGAVCFLAFRRGGGDPLTRWQKVKCGLLLFAIFGTIVLFRYQMTATRVPVVLDRLTGQVCWGFDSVSCRSFAQPTPPPDPPAAPAGPWTKYQQAPAPARSTN